MVADDPLLSAEVGETAQTPMAAGIAKKLCKAMKAVQRVEKRGRNEFHRYRYAKEEDVAEEVRDAMADAGLALVFDIERMDTEARATAKGGTTYLTTLHILYTLLDSDTGGTWTFHMIGQSLDDQDKGIYKALTGAQKYVYLKLLMIGTGDDPEADQPERAEPARGRLGEGATTASAFKPGDQATHTDVRTAQPKPSAPPTPARPPATTVKTAGKAAMTPKPAEPPGKAALGKPKPKDGPAITDEEWDQQMTVWNDDPVAVDLLMELKAYYGIRTTAELTETQRFGFQDEMTRRLGGGAPL